MRLIQQPVGRDSGRRYSQSVQILDDVVQYRMVIVDTLIHGTGQPD